MDAETTDIEVQVNGITVGRLAVPTAASKREMELYAMTLPAVQEQIGEMTIKGFAIVQEGVVNIIA